MWECVQSEKEEGVEALIGQTMKFTVLDCDPVGCPRCHRSRPWHLLAKIYAPAEALMYILLQEGDRLVVSARTTYSSGVAAQESYKVRCPHLEASKACVRPPLRSGAENECSAWDERLPPELNSVTDHPIAASSVCVRLFQRSRQAQRVLQVGDVVLGTVQSVQLYGAFLDLGGGISGLLHISQISHDRVNSVGDVLSVGDKIKVRQQC